MSASKRANSISPTTTYLVANFTKRDLILYALGIGCCSEECNGDELRFVYEKHPSFEMFPTFLLTMYFAAEPDSHNSNGKSGIRPFPPDSMTLSTNNESGIIPTMLLKNHGEVKQVEMLPILHISQSLVFHNEILFNNKSNGTDYPLQIHLRTEITSIRPRNVGTFVTTETKYYQRECCIATAQMTALVYGMNPDKVIQWQGHQSCVNDALSSNENVPKSATTEKTMHTFTIPSNAALLYRLSGDYNPIHVEGTDGDAPGPLLHGLCTMGYATRAILKHIRF